MPGSAVVLAGVLAVVLTAALIPRRRASTERHAAVLADRLGLPFRQKVAAPLDARRRWADLGRLAGAAVAGALLLLTSASTPDLGVGVLFTLLAAGTAVGAAFGLMPVVQAPTPQRGLLDRGTAQVADLVPPLEHRASRIVAALALVALALALLVGADATAVLLLAGSVVGSALLAELAGRRLAASPRTADDAVALAWDDALRAVDVRLLVEAVLGTSALAVVAASWFVLPADPAAVVSLAVVAGTALVGLRSIGPAARWFEGRLWPAGVPGGVGATAD